MREQISAIASLGASSAARLMTGGDIVFAQTHHNVPAIGRRDAAIVSWEQADTFALTVFLNQDRIIAALDDDIAARAQDDEALDPDQKERALATLAEERLTLDAEIAELVFGAHADGVSGIELRSDTHPLAVLSLALVTVPRAEPGSTPGYSWDLRR